ncbi:MAG: HTH domain-containing protein [Bacilli bacterium]
MGKISNAIMMLEYLNTGNKYTARELSEKIGVSEGMIKYYKNELEESGIRIETFKGPNGGYFLLNNKKPYNTFNKYDIQLLEKIKNNVNGIEKKKLFELIDKINKIYNISEEKAKFITDIKNKGSEDIKIFENDIKNNERLDIIYEGIGSRSSF